MKALAIFRRIQKSVRKWESFKFHKTYCHVSTSGPVFKSPFPDLEIKQESLPEFIFKRLDKYPGKIALVDAYSKQSFSFSEVKSYALKVASGLRKLGYKKGDVIALHATNSAEYIIALLALIANGITITGTNPAFTTGELSKCLDVTGASCVITMSTLLPIVNAAIKSNENVRNRIKDVITIDEISGYRSMKFLMADDGSHFPSQLSLDLENDIAALLFSSGTSGFPKPVVLNHRSLVANLQILKSTFDMVTEDDTLLTLLPLFHGFGMVVISFFALCGGSKVVTVPNFEPKFFLQTLEQEKISFLHLVPPIAIFLAKHPMVKEFDISHVKNGMCAAAPLGESIQQELMEKQKMAICQGYGMTEFIAGLIDKKPFTFGTVGMPTSNCICKIVDHESQQIRQTGESGEICLKGPQLMTGYLNDPEATISTIRDGWIHTGDIGYFRKDGKLVITDRIKDLIKYKGFQVAPAELEHILLKHNDIAEAAVIGVPDDRAGEVPRAYVVLKQSSSLTDQQIKSFVKDHVADYKQLRGGVVITNDIPKSPSGKILRRVLKEELQKKT